MHDLHQLLRVTLEAVRDAVIVTDPSGRVVSFNPAAEQITGWKSSEVVGNSIEAAIILRAEVSDEPVTDLRNAPETAVLIGQGGRRVSVHVSIQTLTDAAGGSGGLLLTFRDVAEAVELAHKIAHRAQYDPLTGLPNRILLVDRLEQAARLADRQTDQIAVIFVNLDTVNERYTLGQLRDVVGSAAADGLIQDTAYRLTDALRESDTVCRLGGGEFVLMLPGLKAVDDMELLVNKLMAELTRPFVLEEHTLTAGCSIGVSLYPQDANDVHTLLRLADSAMSIARRSGPNQYRFAGQEALAIAISPEQISN